MLRPATSNTLSPVRARAETGAACCTMCTCAQTTPLRRALAISDEEKGGGHELRRERIRAHTSQCQVDRLLRLCTDLQLMDQTLHLAAPASAPLVGRVLQIHVIGVRAIRSHLTVRNKNRQQVALLHDFLADSSAAVPPTLATWQFEEALPAWRFAYMPTCPREFLEALKVLPGVEQFTQPLSCPETQNLGLSAEATLACLKLADAMLEKSNEQPAAFLGEAFAREGGIVFTMCTLDAHAFLKLQLCKCMEMTTLNTSLSLLRDCRILSGVVQE